MKRFAGSASFIPVRAARLDTLMQDVSLSKNVELSRIRFVKVDVEGAELEVLKGMRRILGEIRPLLIIEVRKENLKEFLNIMDAHSYECKELIDKRTKGATGYFLCKPHQCQYQRMLTLQFVDVN